MRILVYENIYCPLFPALSDPLQLPANVQGGVYAQTALVRPGLLL